MEARSCVFDSRRGSELDAEAVGGVVDRDVETRTTVEHVSVEERVEHILRVVLRVAYLSVVGTVHGV